VKFPGYTIPSGWTVLLATPAIQLNPETFKDPLTFDPCRWKVGGFTIAEPYKGGLQLINSLCYNIKKHC